MNLLRKVILYGIAVALLLNTGFIIMAKDIQSYVVYEPVQVEEQYTEEVPYFEQEEYIEEVPMPAKDCRQEPVDYSVRDWSGTYECLERGGCAKYDVECKETDDYGICTNYQTICVQEGCARMKTVCSLKLSNKYDQSGVYTVSAYFVGDDGRVDQPARSMEISAYGEGEWTYEYEMISPDEHVFCDYKIEKVPTYETCEEHDVLVPVKKYRKVIRYKTETKTRTVTKSQPVTKELEVSRYLS